MKVIDARAAKKPKKWEEEVEVAEVDSLGRPTGATKKVPCLGGVAKVYADREAWKDQRLQELEAAGKATVEVLRGSDDDVMGISWED